MAASNIAHDIVYRVNMGIVPWRVFSMYVLVS